MASKAVKKVYQLTPSEGSALKAVVFDLSEYACKQALYGLIQVLSCGPIIGRDYFEAVIEDARKYVSLKKGA